ncbi:hypothetical protein CLOP_g3903 [Closterium sp. NIES-67]|nr:hypothetical protein CLOP_g3903 [Closterium sp. NIES-67]
MRRALRVAWDSVTHDALPSHRLPQPPLRVPSARGGVVPSRAPASLPHGFAPSHSPASLPAARALLAWSGRGVGGGVSRHAETRGEPVERAVAGGGSTATSGVGNEAEWRGVRWGSGGGGGCDEAWRRSTQWRAGGWAVADAVQGARGARALHTPGARASHTNAASASRLSSRLSPRLLALLPTPWQELLQHPRTALHRIAWQYRDAAALQVEAFWRNHSLLLLSAGGISLSLLLWGCSFRLASLFLTMPPNSLGLSYLLASSTAVTALGVGVRAYATISPAMVYRMAMCALNTHAGALEVLGAPLLGAPVRAYVQGGGGIVLSGIAVRPAPRQCWLVFRVRGAEGRAVVNVEVQRHNGQYGLRLVALDVAAGSAGSQQLLVVGDDAALARAQPVLQGLRLALDGVESERGAEGAPVVKAQP